MGDPIRFLLNDTEISLTEAAQFAAEETARQIRHGATR